MVRSQVGTAWPSLFSLELWKDLSNTRQCPKLYKAPSPEIPIRYRGLGPKLRKSRPDRAASSRTWNRPRDCS